MRVVPVLAILMVIAVLPIAVAQTVDTSRWILVEPGTAFESTVCDYKLCWVQFAMPFYTNEIWQYSDGHIWIWRLYIPDYTPQPMSFGIGVWNGNATVVLVTYNLIRVIVDAPAGAKSTLILYGIKPYRIKINGEDITPKAVPSLEALNKSGLAWFHNAYALYLRATHHSPVIWDIQLSEIPESQPTETQTPVVVLPYVSETQTNTTLQTIVANIQTDNTLYMMILLIVVVLIFSLALMIIRRR